MVLRLWEAIPLRGSCFALGTFPVVSPILPSSSAVMPSQRSEERLRPYYREFKSVARATQWEPALLGFNPDSLAPESQSTPPVSYLCPCFPGRCPARSPDSGLSVAPRWGWRWLKFAACAAVAWAQARLRSLATLGPGQALRCVPGAPEDPFSAG